MCMTANGDERNDISMMNAWSRILPGEELLCVHIIVWQVN